jgi:hypothetical protein
MACDKREALAQGSDCDVIVSRVRRLFENEEVYHAIVQGRRFGAYRWSHRLNICISSAGRF